MNQTKPNALPKVGDQLEGGKYAGLLTDKEGQPYMLVLLPEQGRDMTWKAATKWAEGLKGSLPSRIEAAMLFQHLRSNLIREWHWTDETHESDSSYAWGCYFDFGFQYYGLKSAAGGARAVRRLPLQSFDPLDSAVKRTDAAIADLRQAAVGLIAACDSISTALE